MTTKKSGLGLIFWSFFLLFLKDPQLPHASFTEVSEEVLGGPLDGLIATFGDFNMDKNTDVFVITENGHKAELYMKDGNGSYLLNLYPPASIERLEDTITSIAAGDFNGDFQMDVLITTKPNSDPLNKSVPTKAFVYWGNVTTGKFDNWTLVTDQLADQPLVMDYNADMIPDLFGEVMSGQKKFWTRGENDSQSFMEVNLVGREDSHLVIPNSNAFLDVTGNYAANLVMATTEAGSTDITFEVWSYLHSEDTAEKHDVWQFDLKYGPPTGVTIAHLGISTFADMNADSHMDQILPVCYNTNCTNGAIYVKYDGNEEWTRVFELSEVHLGDERWGFVPPTTTLTAYATLPLVARTGDYNLDTFTDLIVLVQSSIKGVMQRRTVVLKNTGGNSLEVAWATEPTIDITAPIAAAFIDIQRTGQLDILVVNQTESGTAQILLLDNILTVDAYFVKTEVLSGLCKRSCPGDGSNNIPYGVNQPGPIVRYDTTGSTGQPQTDSGCQLSQSAYFSLQLPYVLLGLGLNPNFVDTLKVGVPAATNPKGKNNRVDSFSSIIPNSQLIVVPYPLDTPDEWISKILIIPGQSVLFTGIVLICTGVVLALTAALLHLKERKDDDKEKRQEAHRFHFDAM